MTPGRLIAVALVAVAASACSPSVATRGNLVPQERLNQVIVGASTQGDVAAALGSPTTISTFDPNVWFYIGQRTEKTAFFQPTITERRVLVVRFTPAGVVQSVEEKTLADGQDVEMVARETPTLGRRMTVLEQLLGNIGRFGGGEQ